MLKDTDFFDKLEQWVTIGDVLPTVTWQEAVGPDERYEVHIVWKFRDKQVGIADIIIEPLLDDTFRFYWVYLSFADEWQNKGLYSTLIEQLPPNLLKYGIVEIVATPQDKEAERRLASKGFQWRGPLFVLDHRS